MNIDDVYITSNVGIGVENPTTILNIVGSDPILRITGKEYNDSAAIQLLENTNDSAQFGSEIIYDGRDQSGNSKC